MHQLLTLWTTLVERLEEDDPERGDVPGWVMVTIMSAALVVAILGVATPQLTSTFSDAVTSVTGH